ncbi:MAG: hypothetical protein ABFD44_00155 [Anaerolineaceae bacterium]
MRQNKSSQSHIQIKPRLIQFAVVILLFLFVVAWNRPYVLSSHQDAQPTLTSVPTQAVNTTPTVKAEETVPMHEDTTGIIIGGVALVLIVIGGTISTILRKPNPKS